jgi:eukaryotic-like serine/threonine-protein kinase
VPELKEGERINRRYQIDKFVAAGGFGEVYRAHDPRLNVKVAMKILKDNVRHDAAARNDFLSEAQRQAKLRDHPHVVTVLDVDEVERDGEPFPFCVLEWLPGGTLQQFVPAGGARPNVDQVCTWISQTADALSAAAERSLIHRDVKPGNIFRDERGNAKLADFGLAKMISRDAGQVSQAIGTLAFMPPEQFVVGGAITPAADVFALGVTLWLLLSGKLPLPHGSQALNNPSFVLPHLRSVFPGCPEELDDLVSQMLAADPNIRPTAVEVRQVLSEGRSGVSTVTSTVRPAGGPGAQTGTASAPASQKSRGLLSGWSLFRSATAGKSAILSNQEAVLSTERLSAGSVAIRSLDEVQSTPRAEGAPVRWTDPEETHPLPLGVSLCLGSPRFRHESTVNAVALTPDGTRAVAACEDKTVRVWDLISGQEVLCLPGHSGQVLSVAVSTNGKHAVSAGADKTLRVWDLQSGLEVAMMTGHTDAVRAVAITPNGRAVISGSGDRSVQVWDVESGRDLFWLGRHTGAVHAVAITPDGRVAGTAGADSTLRGWERVSRPEV